MKTKKAILLLAMQTILQEYKDKTHWVANDTCALCKLFYVREELNNKIECGKCPMKIFKKNYQFGCMQRKCHPLDFRPKDFNIIPLEPNYSAVMEFYEKAIEKTKTLTSKEIDTKKVWKFLIDIDNEIADKYLYMRF